MNYKYVFKMLGIVLSIEAGLLLLPTGISLFNRDGTAGAFGITIVL